MAHLPDVDYCLWVSISSNLRSAGTNVVFGMLL